MNLYSSMAGHKVKVNQHCEQPEFKKNYAGKDAIIANVYYGSDRSMYVATVLYDLLFPDGSIWERCRADFFIVRDPPQ